MSSSEHPILPAPHAHAPTSVSRVMYTVAAALTPALVFGVYQFGWPALDLLLITVAATLLTEAGSLWIGGKPVRPFVTDGTALLTGLLLAMSLPPWAPWWIGLVGGAFAALIGKHVFGGVGQNLFNPAMLARVALLISFPVEMTTWVAPHPLFSSGAPGIVDGFSVTFGSSDIDAVTSASLLGHARTELSRGVTLDSALAGFHSSAAGLGHIAGSLGETSALLILAGGVFLLARRIITWQIPASMVGAVLVLATIFHWVDPLHYASPIFHLLTGGLLLGSFFIATDPVGAPSTPRGQLLFGAGCGSLVFIIRTWGGYPEGLAFAVLLMNAATPVIDHYMRPRIYGRDRSRRPLSYGEDG